MHCTMDLTVTSTQDGYQQWSRSLRVPAASTSRSFLMAQSGDDTGNSCAHATRLRRTTNLAQQRMSLSSRSTIRWRSRGEVQRPGTRRNLNCPRPDHKLQCTDQATQDDPKEHLNQEKDFVVKVCCRTTNFGREVLCRSLIDLEDLSE